MGQNQTNDSIYFLPSIASSLLDNEAEVQLFQFSRLPAQQSKKLARTASVSVPKIGIDFFFLVVHLKQFQTISAFKCNRSKVFNESDWKIYRIMQFLKKVCCFTNFQAKMWTYSYLSR